LKNCWTKNLIEADLAKNRITELKSQMESGKKEEIMQRHFIEVSNEKDFCV